MLVYNNRVPYACSRLNKSTFVIVHNDKYEEHPFIYVKLYEPLHLALLLDTGCGALAATDEDSQLTDLREFLEKWPVSDNGGRPLCPQSGDIGDAVKPWNYTVICSHCHFDHIGGIEAFRSSTVIASGNDKEFLSRENLPQNSLCGSVGMELPSYTISHFTQHKEWLTYEGQELGLQALHTPGHTPDSLAIYDSDEHYLFVGDSFYRRKCLLPWGRPLTQPIVFPPQGDWREFMNSLEVLTEFVEASGEASRVSGTFGRVMQIACSHTTEAADAKKILANVKAFFTDVIAGKVPVKERVPRGPKQETFVLWQPDGEPEFSLFGPQRLREEYLHGA